MKSTVLVVCLKFYFFFKNKVTDTNPKKFEFFFIGQIVTHMCCLFHKNQFRWEKKKWNHLHLKILRRMFLENIKKKSWWWGLVSCFDDNSIKILILWISIQPWDIIWACVLKSKNKKKLSSMNDKCYSLKVIFELTFFL